jgi:hypothetical protein
MLGAFPNHRHSEMPISVRNSRDAGLMIHVDRQLVAAE